MPNLPAEAHAGQCPSSPHLRRQALFKSTVQLVLLPTVLGIAANEWFKKQAGGGHTTRQRGYVTVQQGRGLGSVSANRRCMLRKAAAPACRCPAHGPSATFSPRPTPALPCQVDVVRPAMPLVALALTVVLCAVPVAQVAGVLRTSGLAACTPVIALHSFGYLLGYALPRALGFNEKTSRTGGLGSSAAGRPAGCDCMPSPWHSGRQAACARPHSCLGQHYASPLSLWGAHPASPCGARDTITAVSIETGMQSAAMGYALSSKHFADVLVAVPSSVSIVFMVRAAVVMGVGVPAALPTAARRPTIAAASLKCTHSVLLLLSFLPGVFPAVRPVRASPAAAPLFRERQRFTACCTCCPCCRAACWRTADEQLPAALSAGPQGPGADYPAKLAAAAPGCPTIAGTRASGGFLATPPVAASCGPPSPKALSPPQVWLGAALAVVWRMIPIKDGK